VDDVILGTHCLITGDVNGDGKEDLIANSGRGPENTEIPFSIAWIETPKNLSRSDEWIRHVFARNDAPGGSHYMGIGDVNGDGHMDFMASRGHGVGLLWFKGPDFQSIEIDPKNVGPHSLVLQDLDGDGDLDGATCGRFQTGDMLWYENDGLGNFTKHLVGVNQGSYDLRAEDMDSDGDLDFLVAGHWSGNVVWYENR